MFLQPSFQHKKVLLTGGAGFVGSHLLDRLLAFSAQVTVVDNLVTGQKQNIAQHRENQQFRFIKADASHPPSAYLGKETFDYIFHLASPASPVDFKTIPREIYAVNGFGTHYLVQLAKTSAARLLFTSTSEVYGDPEVHPQPETYFGNVNPLGPRAPYDESKRFGEMVVSNAIRQHQIDARIVRIFNTYGPRMRPNDGRVMPAFITAAQRNEPLHIHGHGEQTRSFCFVDDLVEYILRAMAFESARGEVINIGNQNEISIKDLAEKIVSLTSSSSQLEFQKARTDDPERRRPDLTKAKTILEFEPQVSLDQGLNRTIEYFKTTTPKYK